MAPALSSLRTDQVLKMVADHVAGYAAPFHRSD